MAFDYSLDYKHLDLRKHPELYRVGIGEQGVLMVEPYKSEILPFWRFKTPEEAQTSAEKIFALFEEYKKSGDFVGMDMARKFLQMGYTRARRYANHPSGRKYSRNPQNEADAQAAETIRDSPLPQDENWADSPKAQSARIFYGYYEKAKDDADYLERKQAHIVRYGK